MSIKTIRYDIFAKAALSLLLAGSVPVFAAEAVTPLGAFARIKATADHAYGHEVRLWRSGDRVMGQVLYWDGNPEAQKGQFSDSAFNRKSGELQFSLTITRRDVRPAIQSAASFSGRLEKNTLTGQLKWEGSAAQTRGKAGVETLGLPKSQNAVLDKFASADDWRKAMAEQ